MATTNIPLIILRLEGPLQSWGLQSRWDDRDTGTEPSKSGVIGMIACALGIPKMDPELERLDAELTMAVREDQEGSQLQDFQTIREKFLLANGKESSNIATIISRKKYLEDATFLVLLNGPEALLEQIYQALQSPKWPLYLGRKACVPTSPILVDFTHDYVSFEDALSKIPQLTRSWHPTENEMKIYKSRYPNLPKSLRCVVEDPTAKTLRYDRIRTNLSRMYDSRFVKIFYVNNPSKSSSESASEPTQIEEDKSSTQTALGD